MVSDRHGCEKTRAHHKPSGETCEEMVLPGLPAWAVATKSGVGGTVGVRSPVGRGAWVPGVVIKGFGVSAVETTSDCVKASGEELLQAARKAAHSSSLSQITL